MPEPCTFRVRFGAERNSNFQNASMSLSTFLRFLYAPHTIFRVLFQRPWINFSSNDICFFLPYTVEKQRTKKKCVAFATRADTLYLIISFGFDFTCSLPSRFSVFFFHFMFIWMLLEILSFCSLAVRVWVRCAMTPLIYFIEMACVQRALHQMHFSSQRFFFSFCVNFSSGQFFAVFGNLFWHFFDIRFSPFFFANLIRSNIRINLAGCAPWTLN